MKLPLRLTRGQTPVENSALTVTLTRTVRPVVIPVTRNGVAVQGAEVQLDDQKVLTPANGEAEFSIAPGNYQLQVRIAGVLLHSERLTV